jgi:hypothetical protein
VNVLAALTDRRKGDSIRTDLPLPSGTDGSLAVSGRPCCDRLLLSSRSIGVRMSCDVVQYVFVEETGHFPLP